MNTIHKSTLIAALTVLAGAVGTVDADAMQAEKSQGQAAEFKRNESPLVQKVRRATARFRNVNAASAEGWVPGTPCVSGPNTGAMGVHFVLPARIDGVANADEPEALIYEPQANGGYRLVGIEYIVIAEEWARLHPEGGTPSLDGHLTNYVGAPNRYGLPAFYELHVWAWENNPEGSFADWNTQVSCEKQQAN